MTIISDPDVRDGQPIIDGTTVTVIDAYHMFARDGRDPAEVAYEYDVDLARVHEAIAYYYDHATKMQEWEELTDDVR